MLPDLDQLSKYRSVSSWLMSAIGTKRTFAFAPHMSAFGGKADIYWTMPASFTSRLAVARKLGFA